MIELVNMQDACFAKFGLKFIPLDGKPLGLKNMEHALCEFYKYYLIYYEKGGKSKNREHKVPAVEVRSISMRVI